MQHPDRVQEQSQQEASGITERLVASNVHRKMVEDRKGVVERDFTKFRALNEVFVLCENSLFQHRTQVAAISTSSNFVLEGIDAAIEELRRLQKQTHDLSLKNEGALNALVALEETFKQAAAQAVARLREVGAVVVPRAVTVAESAAVVPEEPEEPEEDPLALLGGLEDPSDSAKEPIGEPKHRASRKSK
jgi:hypothetical protein